MTTKKVATKKNLKLVDERPKRQPAKPTKTDGKLSQLDAACKVLADSKEPMNTKQMVEAMAAKALWTSPGGNTPAATLYSAILREIKAKGTGARFKKAGPGNFAINS
jgi:hypothetical protein